MAERIVLNNITPHLTFEKFLTISHIKEAYADAYREDFEKALSIVRERAVLVWANVDKVDEEGAVIEGVRFKSKVMADNLKEVKKVFLYAATSGNELKETDVFDDTSGLVADMLTNAFLRDVMREVHEYVTKVFGVSEISAMNPGSLPDWDITNNPTLFDMLGDVKTDIGLSLTDAGYIKPFSSTSGILFPNQTEYVNCALCTKADCIGRRKAFNAEEYRRIFSK